MLSFLDWCGITESYMLPYTVLQTILLHKVLLFLILATIPDKGLSALPNSCGEGLHSQSRICSNPHRTILRPVSHLYHTTFQSVWSSPYDNTNSWLYTNIKHFSNHNIRGFFSCNSLAILTWTSSVFLRITWIL